MDLSDINKVANRKRINTDAEGLREKMSRESSKIIKLRVAQDTAYWDVKERLRGVEAEHERLQRNMLDLQMQHEALSAQYQDELRLRPETLNKLAATRDICDVLEDYAGRVRESLQRASADRTALSHSYADAARRVQAAHAQHARAAHAAMMNVTAMRDQLAVSESHCEKLMERANAAEVVSGVAREQQRAAVERADILQARADELMADLHEKERAIAELQQKAEVRAVETDAKAERDARDRATLQRELETRDVALEKMRSALAAAEERVARASVDVAQITISLQNLEQVNADLKRELETIGATNDALQEKIEEKDRELRASATREEEARKETAAALASLQTERETRAHDAAVSEAASAEAERTLAERADTVARLMRDVVAETEARARCESARSSAIEQARTLATRLQNKEEELAGQAKIVFDLRNEKERLQDVISGMQGTIDNIQKELKRELPTAGVAAAAAAASSARREPPERDDNALPSPPKSLRQSSRALTPAPACGVFAAPHPRPPASAAASEDLLYHFLSDSSADADALDPAEVNARFEAMALARGPRPNAISLNALKRRQHSKAQGPTEDDVSLSQVKTELAARGRSFFRNKRLDTKTKKFK